MLQPTIYIRMRNWRKVTWKLPWYWETKLIEATLDLTEEKLHWKLPFNLETELRDVTLDLTGVETSRELDCIT